MSRQRGGFTLIELIIATGIFLVLSVMVIFGIRFFTDISQHNSMLQAEQMVERDFVFLNNDVRNAKSILEIHPDSFSILSFNFKQGFNNSQLFDPVNVGTVTYRYVVQNNRPALQRTSVFNNIAQSEILLKGIVQAPSTAKPWFAQVGTSIHTVEVVFHLDIPFWKGQKEYRARIAMRGQGQ